MADATPVLNEQDHTSLPVRASSIDAWTLCARRALANQFKDEIESIYAPNPTFQGYNTLIGSCVHALVANDPMNRLAEISEWFENCRKRVEGEEILTSKAASDWDMAEEQAALCLNALDRTEGIEMFRDKDRPKLAEDFLSHAGKWATLTGHMDLFDIGTGTLIDIKCSGSYQPSRYDGQIGAYADLLERGGHKVKAAEIWFVPIRALGSRSDREVQKIPYDLEVSQAHVKAVMMNMKRMIHIYRESSNDPRVVPASPGCWACSRRFCRVYGTEFCEHYAPEEDLVNLDKENK